jgi:hypothetical protein
VIEGVKSKTYAGGIGGEVPSSLSNALNVGLINIEAVSPNTECSVGYIVGSVSNNSSRLINSYWLDIPGGALGIAGIGYDRREGENNDSIKGLSPEEASDISNYPGWDFKGRWEIPASGSQLPRLRSESDAGKYNEEEWKLLWN